MFKIKDLPASERPREKAIRYGFKTLSNDELLAIIVSSGTRKFSAIEIAHNILKDHKGFSEVAKLEFEEFLDYEGVSYAKAIKLKAVFEIASRSYATSIDQKDEKVDLEYLFKKYGRSIGRENQELFIIIALDKRQRITKEKELYRGTKTRTIVSVKEIVRELLLADASFFYLIHNHPGGGLFPSDEDIVLTKDVLEKTRELKIKMLDHIIVSINGYYSFQKGSSSESTLKTSDNSMEKD
jgi:DNA repair protein RadC